MAYSKQHEARGAVLVAVDVGSTVVKVAQMDRAGRLLRQDFYPRDFEAGISRQVERLVGELRVDIASESVRVCSSANGGLRVGIVCLTKHFSGAAFRNQVLLAGANPIFVRDFDEGGGDTRHVDILLVGGGIDCDEAAPLVQRLERFNPDSYRYGALVYAGNSHFAGLFQSRFLSATLIDNPLGERLSSRVGSVFEAVRRAYLDDLVYKEGVSELRGRLAWGIRPTPEVASQGFLRSVLNQTSLSVVGPCLALDIGGATTDLHYTAEIVREDSDSKPLVGSSVARYVFTDLGIMSSRDNLMLRLRAHPRLYDFLVAVVGDNVRDTYSQFREGEYAPSAELLSYACLFIAMDRFARGDGPGLPAADLSKVAQVLLTGGAAQGLSEHIATDVVDLLLVEGSSRPLIQIDRRYRIWVDGVTWTEEAAT